MREIQKVRKKLNKLIRTSFKKECTIKSIKGSRLDPVMCMYVHTKTLQFNDVKKNPDVKVHETDEH